MVPVLQAYRTTPPSMDKIIEKLIPTTIVSYGPTLVLAWSDKYWSTMVQTERYFKSCLKVLIKFIVDRLQCSFLDFN